MFRTAGKLTLAVVLVFGSMGVGALFSYRATPGGDDTTLADYQQAQSSATPAATSVATATETIPPYTPLASLTPSQTLKPPPTFEPPTTTPTASVIPSLTLAPTTEISVSIPGLKGAETPTPTTTPGCEPREDWQLTYTVQRDDALASIADKYGTWVNELAEANCITDKNLITVGQVLRVPGENHPYEPEVECLPWQVLTPIDGAVTIEANGTLTFNWLGPLAPINLIRVHLPDGSVYEQMVELRQNDTFNLNENLPLEGTYTWYVYPLGRDFMQIDCIEGGPWTFYKPASDEPTPTAGANTTTNTTMGGVQ
ncbi:MAG: LysM peptidoglycan-binding domain-containing protein [Anaerolineae bacterium]|nr:LysM peptidoglycan-binding domain-containing protein [Anaerolineae bacterium]